MKSYFKEHRSSREPIIDPFLLKTFIQEDLEREIQEEKEKQEEREKGNIPAWKIGIEKLRLDIDD